VNARRLGSVLVLGCALTWSACSPDPRPEEEVPARLRGDAPSRPAAAAADVTPIESLSLTQALTALDAQHPDLAALRHQIEAAAARAEGAGALPAPAALIRAENVPLHRGSSFDQGNYIAGLAFDLPLQGRLSAARAVEQREGELVSRDLELHRHELLRAARDAFASALAAQRAAEYHEAAASSAETLAGLLERRVARGDLTPDEATWAAVEAARSRLDAEQSRSVARRAHARLTEAIGSSRPVISVGGDLDETVGTPDLAALLRLVDEAPGVRRADAAVALREAAVELARAERIPDVRLEVAYRRLEQTDQHSVDAGLLIPFPFLGGSRQRADAARLELEAARARGTAARLETTRAVQDAYERLATAVSRAQALSELLPRVDGAMVAVTARLTRGDISALEAIPARRVAISYRLEHLDALADAVRAWADLDAALGAAP
jgi:cobalt-zinc-cadmium efflux system outer membrane protein